MRFTLAVAALLATAEGVRLGQKLEARFSPGKLDDVFNGMDLNKDGAVTKEEAHKAITEYAKAEKIDLPEDWEKHGEALFDDIDENGDGSITMDEVHAAIWEAVDTDDSNGWSLKEVKKALKALAKEVGVKLKKGW